VQASLAAALVAVPSPDLDRPAALAVAGPLLPDGASTATVVYPQFGGLAPDGRAARVACVMVVLRQSLLTSAGDPVDVVRTCDVRLARHGDGWQVSELVSVGGEPVDRPGDLDPLVAAVLDSPDIDLPDSARWDLHAGRVAPDVLRVLLSAADRAPVSVSAFETGHPVNVFGTDRPSDHSQGRAVDLWAVDGAPVVDQSPAGSPARAVLDGAFADPLVRQVGSPVGSDLDGPGRRRSFVNVVHADHLHLATAGPPGAAR
jgi:hypothetical protein